jgi:hypothetical protein
LIAENIDARYSTHCNVGGDLYNYNNYFPSSNDNEAGESIAPLLTWLQEIYSLADKLRRKIHKWLAAPDPSSNHNDTRKLRQPTTGTWFVNGEDFKRWKSALNSFIWLHGIRMFSCDLFVLQL